MVLIDVIVSTFVHFIAEEESSGEEESSSHDDDGSFVVGSGFILPTTLLRKLGDCLKYDSNNCILCIAMNATLFLDVMNLAYLLTYMKIMTRSLSSVLVKKQWKNLYRKSIDCIRLMIEVVFVICYDSESDVVVN